VSSLATSLVGTTTVHPDISDFTVFRLTIGLSDDALRQT
jgi:hypothetical protein